MGGMDELQPNTPVEVAPGVMKPYGDCTTEELEGALELLRASDGERTPDPTAQREEELASEAGAAREKAARRDEQARIAAHMRLIEDEITSRTLMP